MTLSPKAIANGCPRCWECGKRFVYSKGGGFIFAVVTDRAGGDHRVHKGLCALQAVKKGDGVKLRQQAVPA